MVGTSLCYSGIWKIGEIKGKGKMRSEEKVGPSRPEEGLWMLLSGSLNLLPPVLVT